MQVFIMAAERNWYCCLLATLHLSSEPSENMATFTPAIEKLIQILHDMIHPTNDRCLWEECVLVACDYCGYAERLDCDEDGRPHAAKTRKVSLVRVPSKDVMLCPV